MSFMCLLCCWQVATVRCCSFVSRVLQLCSHSGQWSICCCLCYSYHEASAVKLILCKGTQLVCMFAVAGGIAEQHATGIPGCFVSYGGTWAGG
jgi:hypothetical protein